MAKRAEWVKLLQCGLRGFRAGPSQAVVRVRDESGNAHADAAVVLRFVELHMRQQGL